MSSFVLKFNFVLIENIRRLFFFGIKIGVMILIMVFIKNMISVFVIEIFWKNERFLGILIFFVDFFLFFICFVINFEIKDKIFVG